MVYINKNLKEVHTMGMDGNGLSVADALALQRDGNGDGMFGDGGYWIFFLFFLLAWGNNGWGNGFGSGSGGTQGAGFQGWATRADINEGFALNNLQSGINSLQQGICDSTYALTNAITNGFNNTNMGVMQGFNGVERSMCNMSAQLANCCCETREAIQGVNYNMAKNTCDLQNTMNNNTRDILESQNAGTRAILDYLCQDKISTLQAENQSLRLAASQADQNAVLRAAMDANTAEIIRRTGNDCPVPAYVVPNPNCCYGNPVGVSYNGYGNNCGCGC
jgi:hypothetical protein